MPHICTFNLEKISTYINEFINLEINTIRIITILVKYDVMLSVPQYQISPIEQLLFFYP